MFWLRQILQKFARIFYLHLEDSNEGRLLASQIGLLVLNEYAHTGAQT